MMTGFSMGPLHLSENVFATT